MTNRNTAEPPHWVQDIFWHLENHHSLYYALFKYSKVIKKNDSLVGTPRFPVGSDLTRLKQLADKYYFDAAVKTTVKGMRITIIPSETTYQVVRSTGKVLIESNFPHYSPEEVEARLAMY
jgi:hypothetical protein